MTVDYEISPCNRCNYVCFHEEESCPVKDDVPIIWEKMREADGIVFVIPEYYGLPPAIFKAIIERAQGILIWRNKPIIAIVMANGEEK